MNRKRLCFTLVLGAMLALGTSAAKADFLYSLNPAITALTVSNSSSSSYTAVSGNTYSDTTLNATYDPYNPANASPPSAGALDLTGAYTSASQVPISTATPLPSTVVSGSFSFTSVNYYSPSPSSLITSPAVPANLRADSDTWGVVTFNANGVFLSNNSELQFGGSGTDGRGDFLVFNDSSNVVTMTVFHDGVADTNYSLSTTEIFVGSPGNLAVPEPTGLSALLGMGAIGGLGMIGQLWRRRHC
jgi:hypothetical protein